MDQNIEIIRIWISNFKFEKKDSFEENDNSENKDFNEIEDTLKLDWAIENEDSTSYNFRAIADFTYIDDLFCATAEICGEFIFTIDTNDFEGTIKNNKDKQLEIASAAYDAMTDKFDLYVGLFSQEVYNATSFPRRKRTSIDKIDSIK